MNERLPNFHSWSFGFLIWFLHLVAAAAAASALQVHPAHEQDNSTTDDSPGKAPRTRPVACRDFSRASLRPGSNDQTNCGKYGWEAKIQLLKAQIESQPEVLDKLLFIMYFQDSQQVPRAPACDFS